MLDDGSAADMAGVWAVESWRSPPSSSSILADSRAGPGSPLGERCRTRPGERLVSRERRCRDERAGGRAGGRAGEMSGCGDEGDGSLAVGERDEVRAVRVCWLCELLSSRRAQGEEERAEERCPAGRRAGGRGDGELSCAWCGGELSEACLDRDTRAAARRDGRWSERATDARGPSLRSLALDRSCGRRSARKRSRSLVAPPLSGDQALSSSWRAQSHPAQ